MKIQIRKLKNMVDKNKANGLIILCILFYSITCIFFSFKLDGFNGLKVLIILTAIYAIGLTILFIYMYREKINGTHNIKKLQNRYILYGILLTLICTGFPAQFSALHFSNIDKNYKNSQIYNGKILGFKTLGNGKKSGGTWAILEINKNKNNPSDEYLMVCNLLTLQKCEYGYFKNMNIEVKGFTGSKYPLKHSFIIYELTSQNGEVKINSNQQIKIYQNNKIYLWYFILFIFLPLWLIPLLVPQKIQR